MSTESAELRQAVRLLTLAVLGLARDFDENLAAERMRDATLALSAQVDALPPREPQPDSYVSRNIRDDPAHRLILSGERFDATDQCVYCGTARDRIVLRSIQRYGLHARSCVWARLAFALGYAQDDDDGLAVRRDAGGPGRDD